MFAYKLTFLSFFYFCVVLDLFSFFSLFLCCTLSLLLILSWFFPLYSRDLFFFSFFIFFTLIFLLIFFTLISLLIASLDSQLVLMHLLWSQKSKSKSLAILLKSIPILIPIMADIPIKLQGLPSNKWPAYFGTTSHSISSLYLPIEKETSTCLVTLTFPYSFDHYNLYGLGCFQVDKFNFSPRDLLAIFTQLSSSIVMLCVLSCIRHLVWKILSLCSLSPKSLLSLVYLRHA